MAATKNAVIVSHQLFKTPLRSLPGGKGLMDVKFPGKDHYLHHRFIVLGMRIDDGETSFLSIEKGQTGIVAQLHCDFLAGSFHYQAGCNC